MSENELATVANAEVLMHPDRATALVSRGEVVNLLVVQYIDKLQGQIEALEGGMAQTQTIAAEAWKAVYAAWFAQVQVQAMPRLTPWYEAVRNALEGPKLTDLKCNGLPRPDWCSYNFGGVHGPQVERDTRRDEPRVTDLVQRWADRSEVDLVGLIKLGGYPEHMINLSAFPMTWTFATENAHWASDWHSLKINVNITPNAEVLALLDAALAARAEHQKVFQQVHRLRDEINDKNIKTLERRALAKLTMQALGEFHKLPALS